MKLLLCELCGDIIAPLRKDLAPRFCKCQAHAVWWVNGARGILQVYPKPAQAPHAYVLGVHNGLLQHDGRLSAQVVKELLEATPDTYLFKQWGTLLIRIRPGQSNDTSWATELPTVQPSGDDKHDTARGIYRKFEVTRTDGSSLPGGKHARCFYYVLDCNHDKHAEAAIKAYAESCRVEYPFLARDLECILDECKFGKEEPKGG